ncbi:MAG: hypothetical protein LBE74_09570 [Treponema sp.]|jgi:TolB-like protein|nr:hypothetical protein [Treponema sp.]
MKKGIFAALGALIMSGTALSAQTMSLAQTLDAYVREMAQKLPVETRVACPRLNAASVELADYVTEQLNLRLVRDSRFVVVNRDSLSNTAVNNEVDYQLRGNVSDETAVSITQQLGATAVVVGTLRNAGRNYRLDVRVILVEANRVVLQWSAEVAGGADWKKFETVTVGLSFEASVPLTEAEKKTILQSVQRGLQSNQTPLLLPSTAREAEDSARSCRFVIDMDYEEKNGLTVGVASITFVRDRLTLCVSKDHHVTEMGRKRFVQKVGDALSGDAAFFKQVNDELVK